MSQTVLIIEDEDQTRRMFLNSLSFEGFGALGASCGVEGVKLAQTQQPDLVLCDIMMPDMDGYQVLLTLRQSAQTSNILFIFLTAKATMAELRTGMNLGADDYLTKPCTVGTFLDAITTRLQRHADLYPQSQPKTHSIFPECPQLSPIFQFIEDHYHQSIRLQEVADVAGYSPAYLTSIVHSQTGRSVKQWIIERRMVEARKLLSSTDKSIKFLATEIGYADSGYFIRQFRQLHGVSPQAWRQDQRS